MIYIIDTIVIGSGLAGSVMARELASKNKEKVLILEKRNHIGGNCYDELDEHGVLIHKYGPHIFHTSNKKVYEYLSLYTEWYPYSHEVVANVYGKEVPVPFNLNSLKIVFGEKEGEELTEILLSEYNYGDRVAITELLENPNDKIKKIANYVYENVFMKYTMKQWEKSFEEIDKSVLQRVPVLISNDNRYFQDDYQGLPSLGYTNMIKNILNHEGIEIKLSSDAKEYIKIVDSKIYYNGEEFNGKLIYTGPLDELFDLEEGELPYRSLEFKFEYHLKDKYQSKGVVNYTVSEDYTRITEFKTLSGQKVKGTTILKEYPKKYLDRDTQIPYYSIQNEETNEIYKKYLDKVKNIKNFYIIGRMSEYKYYNMDQIVEEALNLSEKL